MELASGTTLAGDAEILDEMVTRSRGEVRRISSPKITSSTATPTQEIRGIHSPRLAAYSPRVGELRGEISPLSGRTGPSPRTLETRTSNLGKSPEDAKY